MTTLREAATQALEALAIGQDAAHEVAQTYHEAMAGYRPARHIAVDDDVRKIEDAITALRAALAEPVEPVAWRFKAMIGMPWSLSDDGYYISCKRDQRYFIEALYTAPPQRKPLTEEEIKDCEMQAMVNGALPFEQRVFFARAIERAHGVK